MIALAGCINAFIIIAAIIAMLGSAAMLHIWRVQRRMALAVRTAKSREML